MMGFDDAAMMGLGAINAGVQIYGAQQQKKGQKKLQQIQHSGQERDYNDKLKELGIGQEDVNRQAGLAQQGSREGDFDRGMGNSGQRDYNRNQIEGDRGRRYDALERQKTRLKADWMDSERSLGIQRKMKKTADTMSMISTALMQGGSGVGGAMGASSMGG